MGGQDIGVLFLQRLLQAFMPTLSQALHFWDQSCKAQDESHPLPRPDQSQQVE